MTILNWALYPQGAAIISDTLATDVASNNPSRFMTKVFVVPHLGLMMAGKNWMFPTMAFWAALIEGLPVASIEQAVEAGQIILRKVAAEHGPALGEDAASLCYLFGWSEAAGKVAGYQFDSREDYRPDPLPYAHGFTPPIDDPPPTWREIAEAQQAADRLLPDDERDNIGGNLMMHELIASRAGGLPEIRITDLGRLDHYESDAARLLLKAA